MHSQALIEAKVIFAREPQRKIALKLAYNKLAHQYNRDLETMTENVKKQLIADLSELQYKINSYI